MRKRPSLSAYVIQLKGLLFSYYWLAVLISSTGILILFTAERISEQLCGAALGGVLAFCYFIQKQKLDEAAFFKQLFTEFNKRYDELNDDLAVVLDTKAVGANAAKLVDYFNLCSEEYLMFKRGFIPIEVWNSWLAGMSQYWAITEVRDLWVREAKTNSYYGFAPDDYFNIKRGVELKKPTEKAA